LKGLPVATATAAKGSDKGLVKATPQARPESSKLPGQTRVATKSPRDDTADELSRVTTKGLPAPIVAKTGASSDVSRQATPATPKPIAEKLPTAIAAEPLAPAPPAETTPAEPSGVVLTEDAMGAAESPSSDAEIPVVTAPLGHAARPARTHKTASASSLKIWLWVLACAGVLILSGIAVMAIFGPASQREDSRRKAPDGPSKATAPLENTTRD
jgi:hypothetical protein